MKFKRILKYIFSAVAVCVTALTFTACRNPELEEVIPTEFGQPKGFWLYKGNTRMREDGREKEILVSEVETADGAEEIRYIYELEYCRSTREIFYIFKLEDESVCLYHYNYAGKSGSVLYTFPEEDNNAEVWDFKLTLSQTYVYACSKTTGVLTSLSAEVLLTDVQGELDGDMLLMLSYDYLNPSLKWYKNGRVYECESGEGFAYNRYSRYGDFAYFFDDHSSRTVDLNTGKLFQLTELDCKYVRVFDEFYLVDSVLYSVNHFYNTDTQESEYFLHKIENGEVEKIYAFGNACYGKGLESVRNGKYLAFRGCYDGRHYKYFSYDLTTGKMSKKNNFSVTSSSSSYKDKYDERETGGYKFYVTWRGYGYSGFLNGYAGYCYYLNREKDGVVEIMQYNLETGYFYDDIAEN